MGSAEVLASVDIVALRLSEAGELELLLIRRAQAPFAGQWALPGVLVNGRCADLSLDAAATRALQEKARVQPQHLEQVATVGNAVRDPRGWSLSTFYLALLPADTELPGEDLCFASLAQVLDEQGRPWFTLVKADQVLRDRDRVEIYRALIADPKEVRRQRAAEGKVLKKGGGERGSEADPAA